MNKNNQLSNQAINPNYNHKVYKDSQYHTHKT